MAGQQVKVATLEQVHKAILKSLDAPGVSMRVKDVAFYAQKYLEGKKLERDIDEIKIEVWKMAAAAKIQYHPKNEEVTLGKR